jgi:hypothetical protein
MQVKQASCDINGQVVQKQLLVKVVLFTTIADYRGIAQLVGPSMKQSPARFGCFMSWAEGTRL